MKLLPKVALAGLGVLFACALHQELMLQVSSVDAWVAVTAFAGLGAAALTFPRNLPPQQRAATEDFRWRRFVTAMLAIGVIALAFVLALFHTATIACEPGGWNWSTEASQRAYCDDTAWVPKI